MNGDMVIELVERVSAVVVALGGFESIKWLINRRSRKRIAEAEADSREADADIREAEAQKKTFDIMREQMEFLQMQLKDKEMRFAEQTAVIRKQNTEISDLLKEKSALELALQQYKCVVEHCPNRQPKNGY